MKIELDNNKVFFRDENLNEEIHPFWLRERVENIELLDQKTQLIKLEKLRKEM